MNILVMGGNGFVGQHLVKRLSEIQGSKINVLCRKRHEIYLVDIETLANVRVVYDCDITDFTAIENHFAYIDIVFNLAGFISFSQRDKEQLIAVNHHGALNVLKASEKHNVKKMIHLSSTAAYGFSDDVIDENTQFDWSGYKKCVYSYSKSLPDDELIQSKMNVIVVNPPTIFGPGDAKLLDIFNVVKKGSPFVPSGRNSVVDVRDLVAALVMVMEKELPNQKLIVTGGNYSIMELNSAISKVLAVRPPRFNIPKFFSPLLGWLILLADSLIKNLGVGYDQMIFGFKDRIHSDARMRALGYIPEYALEESINDTLEFLKQKKLYE